MHLVDIADVDYETEGVCLKAERVRPLDCVIALAALIFFAPVMLIIASIIAASDPGPIFFGHYRVGKNGRLFRCLKFRTMVVDAQARLDDLLAHDGEARLEWHLDHKLRNDPRITKLGRFLRKTSLDELPQIFNVLLGEMSIVGPRPIVESEVIRYGRRFTSYTKVRPGITGLWQVSGRNNTTYRRRVALDVVFARRRGLGLYGKIILMTLPAVIFQSGSY